MTRKIQNKDMIGDKLIYTAKTPNGWSIVIMPDNILIDLNASNSFDVEELMEMLK